MTSKPGLTIKNFVAIVALPLLVFSIIFLYSITADFPTTIPSPMRGLWDEGINWDNNTGQIKAYVRNFGEKDVTISQIYINGTLVDNSVIVPQVLQPNQTAEITISETYSIMPKKITIEIHKEDNGTLIFGKTFIEFKILGVYWDAEWGKIKVVVRCKCDYPDIAFGDIYVNGTLDDEVVITKQSYTDQPNYDIYLSGTYVNKPTNMELRIISIDGYSFELALPFPGNSPIIWSFWLDESIGQIKVVVRFHDTNIPEGAFTYGDIYVNGTLDDAAIIYPRTEPDYYEIVLSRVYVNVPSQVTIKVVTHFGAFDEVGTDELWVRFE